MRRILLGEAAGLAVVGSRVYVAEYFTDSLGVLDLNPEVRRIVEYPTGKGAVVFSVVPGLVANLAAASDEGEEMVFELEQTARLRPETP